jgi:hypothetical protein
MTREEFKQVLDKKGYSYEIEGDRIVVTHKRTVYLSALTSLPPGVEFKNWSGVDLNSLTSLSPGVEFNNEGDVYLKSLTSIPPGVGFKNRGGVDLRSLTSLPPGVEFRNKGDVWLDSLIGDYSFTNWQGNIKGIDSKRLLNFMISKGIFER